MDHKWEICEQCGPFVRCGFCGNNCCNGGTKKLSSGLECNCEEAYKQQEKKENLPEEMHNWKPKPNYDPFEELYDSFKELI